MLKKKRHSNMEIVAKLVQADALARDGRTQGEIARVLGVSVMTFHRWRKAHRAGAPLTKPQETAPGPDRSELIADLQLENARLRRLVTDLLLEKIKLEDDAGSGPNESAGYSSMIPRLRAGRE